MRDVVDSYDTLDEEITDWNATLMDGLEEEDPIEYDIISTDEKEPEIKTIIIEKPIEVIREVPVEVIKEVIREVPVEKGILNTINTLSSSAVGGTKGPLYNFRTRVSPDDDKNRSISQD
jgi:predicted small lipoprotein YifL